MTTGIVAELERRVGKRVAKELYAGVPRPTPVLQSLNQTVQALKTGYEQLTRARGNPMQSAVLMQDLDTFAEILIGYLRDTSLIRVDRVPARSNSAGEEGDVAFDNEYFYVCVANNRWRRVALETF